MSVILNEYSDTLAKHFEEEKRRLWRLLPTSVVISHVGSSAVGIGGKNIVDILIGVDDTNEMLKIRDILVKHGYFEGNDSHEDRIFLASSESETGEGDFHIHICPVDTEIYKDFLILKEYLINNPAKAKEYLGNKQEFANLAGFDRKKYKALKASYVSELLREAKKWQL